MLWLTGAERRKVVVRGWGGGAENGELLLNKPRASVQREERL